LRSPSDSAPRSTFELDQVEGVQHGIADGAAPVEGVEDGDPVRATDGLTVERERQRAELHRGHNDRRIPAALIVAASRERAHRVAVSLDLEPVAVMFSCTRSEPAGGFAARVGIQCATYRSERGSMLWDTD
jgi:hypothetical protein